MTMFEDILSAATTPIAWRRITIVLARLRRQIDHLVAAAIARRERQATREALRHLNGREMRDIGIYQSQMDFGLEEAAQERSRLLHQAVAVDRRARTGLE